MPTVLMLWLEMSNFQKQTLFRKVLPRTSSYDLITSFPEIVVVIEYRQENRYKSPEIGVSVIA